jgi:hypothetical protein
MAQVVPPQLDTVAIAGKLLDSRRLLTTGYLKDEVANWPVRYLLPSLGSNPGTNCAQMLRKLLTWYAVANFLAGQSEFHRTIVFFAQNRVSSPRSTRY